MKKSKKDNTGFVIAVISIIIIIGLIWIAISASVPPDRNKIEEYFERDKSDFIIVIEYFINSGYSYISINESDLKKGVMFTGVNTRYKEIEDKEVEKVLDRLFRKQGYLTIGRNNNTVFFQNWSVLDENRGIAYSINGEDKPEIEFLTKLEILSEDKWYYYEADYNEWRNR